MTRRAGLACATLEPTAVGIGWRADIAADALAAPGRMDLVEVVAETCFVNASARREACAVAEVWPVVPHGVKLSLGSAQGIDVDHARRLGALARDLRAPAVTEHVALTRAGGREIGHLTAVPFTRDAVRAIARNVDQARRELPDVPFLLENIAWTLRWPEDEMAEADFYSEVVAATGCGLLLDLANLHANAINAGIDPLELLLAHPLERVAMVHLAGGADEGGFYVDTHAHPTPDAVFGLLEELVARIGPVPVILERDAAFPPFAELDAEMERARRILLRGPSTPRARTLTAAAAETGARSDRAFPGPLAGRQAALARTLTGPRAPRDSGEAEGFDAEEVRRTRAILHHKRIDDALPLLRHCQRRSEEVRRLAAGMLRAAPRAAEQTAVADARAIVDAAANQPEIADLARRDRLLLRARFDHGHRPRGGPALVAEELMDGSRIWAVKGWGRNAVVRVLDERR